MSYVYLVRAAVFLKLGTKMNKNRIPVIPFHLRVNLCLYISSLYHVAAFPADIEDRSDFS